jgi:D-serine deaminase-like pyridoxal phosphate-dependent protein
MNEIRNFSKVDGFAESIDRPTLLLDKARALANIEKMVRKANRNGVQLRPHFKTHQSAEVGSWFLQKGIHSITVSSLEMAEYFSEHGWTDITVAVPVNLRQIETINRLADSCRLGLLVETLTVCESLDQSLTSEISVWIKIDVGYHRTGIAWQGFDLIVGLANTISNSRWMQFAGILTHAGHSYHSESPEQIKNIYHESVGRMIAVRDELRNVGLDPLVSVGDTPGCSLVDNLGEVDEIRPGNFVFFDLMQLQFGACQEQDIAVAVACPVIAKHENRHQLVIYGGAVHFSKEAILNQAGVATYGGICDLKNQGWSSLHRNSFLSSISQEHGIVDADLDLFATTDIGDLVVVLPVHSCLTANLFSEYQTLSGEAIKKFRY